MRRVWLVALVGLTILSQVSWLPALRPLGVVPNLALVMVVLVGLEGTASTAVAAAVVCGVALDLTSGANLGLWTGLLVLVAVVTGMLHRAGIETDRLLVPAVMVTVGSMIMPLVILTGLVNVVSHWPWGMLAGRFALELVLNLGLMMVLKPVVRRIVPRAPVDMPAMGAR
jgi:cell shape-determining protein MreD